MKNKFEKWALEIKMIYDKMEVIKMPKFNIHLLTLASTWENVEADSGEEALKQAQDDPIVEEYRKHCVPYRLVVEEIEEDEGMEEYQNVDNRI